MESLSIGAGVALLLVVLGSTVALRSKLLRPRYIAQLVGMEPGYAPMTGPGYITRGHYLMLAGLGVLGAALFVSGVVLSVTEATLVGTLIGIGGALFFAIVSGASTVVARRRKPQRWIPREFRDVASG